MKRQSLTSRSFLSNGVNRWLPEDYSKLWVLLSRISQPWHNWYSGWIFLCYEGPPWVVRNVQQHPWLAQQMPGAYPQCANQNCLQTFSNDPGRRNHAWMWTTVSKAQSKNCGRTENRVLPHWEDREMMLKLNFGIYSFNKYSGRWVLAYAWR